MAGVAEKARFYLERSVPQLREWEQKEIFTKDEIRSIVQRRSDFEHRCLAPGVKPEDFTAYANWEISLDALRAKRCTRLKIRHVSSQHATQARVLAIYDRAVFKRPDSKELWLEFLAYTAKVKATKRWRKTMTRVLRLMPRDADLWVLAGRRAAKNGDMGSARGFFMRGCRFCTADETLWVEYARCELEWLAKVESKKSEPKRGKKVAAIAGEQVDDDDAMMFTINDDEEEDADEVILPDPEQTKAAKDVFDKKEAETLENNPAMDGAIPMAIFDVARKQDFFKGDSGERFFDLFASFSKVSVQSKLLQHVLEALQADFPQSPATWSCYIRRPLVGVSPYTADFPRGLRDVLARLEEGLAATSDAAELKTKMVGWADAILALADLDESIRAVLEHVKTSMA
ncbi:U3 small nucleolar RNA-associated protein 6-domain-containing protein [Plectosphaerella cucumerina]|uniref:U3 small nucleolar RNA-associated protein 6-domain-containing protein n=1 Tax=Plectosphaerella cucumerina TaxID=40658 RepID=A0A8K0TE65_9PEZI|nr:U3 small nucleolar RNA-associated protein 6-domain-containing protein [Plectosphaerella cucumerina]